MGLACFYPDIQIHTRVQNFNTVCEAKLSSDYQVRGCCLGAVALCKKMPVILDIKVVDE
jgi:hypothetical protein